MNFSQIMYALHLLYMGDFTFIFIKFHHFSCSPTFLSILNLDSVMSDFNPFSKLSKHPSTLNQVIS